MIQLSANYKLGTVKQFFATIAVIVALTLIGPPSQCQSLQALEHHLRPEVSNGEVKRVGPLSSTRHMLLSLQLPLRNQADLSAFLKRLYTPGSPDYRKYLSVEQFTDKYGPTAEDYQALVAFSNENGLTVVHTPRNRMMVVVDGPIPAVEKAFHTTISEYQHPTERRTFYSPDREPSVDLAVPLLHVSGLDNFELPHTKQASPAYPPAPTGSGPSGSFLPSDMRAAYYGDGQFDGTGQTVGLLELGGYSSDDVNLNYTSIGKSETVPINNVLLGGLTAPLPAGSNDAEPVADIVYSMSVAPHLDQVRVYECCDASYSGSSSAPTIILNSMASENIAKQLSNSWGYAPEYAIEDPIYQEMAAQGQSMFVANGDNGAPQNPGNTTHDDFSPSGDAWVTAVGMSVLTTAGPGGAWAADIYASNSSGGYSDGPTPVPLPGYQEGIATSINQASTVYRNTPDVVANGVGLYLCAQNKCSTGNSGSSFSSPIWASFLALSNQQAASLNVPSTGFLDLSIYLLNEYGYGDFHDVVGGNNGCCGQIVPYQAVEGYDLVSGWGSPKASLVNDLLAVGSDANLNATAVNVSIGPNDSGSTTIEVGYVGGFSGNVTLAASGLPSGVTATFSPPSTTTSSVLTFTSTGAKPGTTAVTVAAQGYDGAVIINLTVNATPGAFTIGADQTAFSFSAAPSLQSNITVTSLNNFSSPVTLSTSGLPDGITSSFSPAVVTPSANGTVSSVMTLTASDSSSQAIPSFIVGTAGSTSYTVPLYFAPPPRFSLRVNPEFQNLAAGSSQTVVVTLTNLQSFSFPTTLTVSGLPSGVTGTFSPAVVTSVPSGTVTSTLTLTSNSSASLVARPRPMRQIPPAVFACCLFPFVGLMLRRGRKSRLRGVLLAIASLMLMLVPIACSSNTNKIAAAPIISTVSVIGTSGEISAQTAFTLSSN